MEKHQVQEALNGLHKALVANQNYQIDYFDVKYLIEEEFKMRLEVKKLFNSYHSWMELMGDQRDVRVILVANLKAQNMQTHLKETIALYRQIKMLRKFYTEIYMRQCKAPKY